MAVKEFHVSGGEKTIDYLNYGNLTVERVCRKITATFFVDERLDSHTVQLLRHK